MEFTLSVQQNPASHIPFFKRANLVHSDKLALKQNSQHLAFLSHRWLPLKRDNFICFLLFLCLHVIPLPPPNKKLGVWNSLIWLMVEMRCLWKCFHLSSLPSCYQWNLSFRNFPPSLWGHIFEIVLAVLQMVDSWNEILKPLEWIFLAECYKMTSTRQRRSRLRKFKRWKISGVELCLWRMSHKRMAEDLSHLLSPSWSNVVPPVHLISLGLHGLSVMWNWSFIWKKKFLSSPREKRGKLNWSLNANQGFLTHTTEISHTIVYVLFST